MSAGAFVVTFTDDTAPWSSMHSLPTTSANSPATPLALIAGTLPDSLETAFAGTSGAMRTVGAAGAAGGFGVAGAGAGTMGDAGAVRGGSAGGGGVGAGAGAAGSAAGVAGAGSGRAVRPARATMHASCDHRDPCGRVARSQSTAR